MTKHKKNVQRSAESTKEAPEKEKKEIVTGSGANESATEETKKENREARVEKKAKKCCGTKKGGRTWIVVIALVAAVVFGYKYVAQNGMPMPLAGDLVKGDNVDASDARQWGYAVGSLVGQQVVQMMAQAPGRDDMDMDMFIRGLNDAVREVEKPLLTQEQVQTLLEERMQMEQEKMVKKAQENLQKSDAFVEEYAKKEGVQKLEGGTLYSVKTEGDGARVGTQAAKLHYRGTHINGEEFDSSRSGGNEEPITLSADMVVPGFGEALKAMRVGDVWEIVIPADQAYGESGMPPAGIDPNEALIFEIEIVGLDNA